MHDGSPLKAFFTVTRRAPECITRLLFTRPHIVPVRRERNTALAKGEEDTPTRIINTRPFIYPWLDRNYASDQYRPHMLVFI